MDIKTKGFIALLVIFTVWLGWKYFSRAEIVYLPPTPEPTTTPSILIQNTADDMAELLAVPLTIATPASASAKVASDSGMLNFIFTNQPGFVVLFGERISSRSAQTTISTLKEKIPAGGFPLIAVDHEGGRVQRLNGAGFTRLPALQAQCQMDKAARQKIIEQSALELKNIGINIVFAPVIDLAKNNPILRDRTCSDDANLTVEVAKETIDQYFKLGMWPVLKHYPGIGASTLDLHNSIDALSEKPIELPLFDSLITNYPKIGVMSTHILVKDISEEAPCSLNPKCLAVFEKDYPSAIVFSDALEMESALTGTDLVSKKPLGLVATQAVLAGNHVLVFGKSPTATELEEVLRQLKLEYTNSKAFREKADRALEKVRELRQEIQTQGN